MAKLILLRHGQSVLNQHDIFTGWIDIPLTAQGIEESYQAGRILSDIPIDIIFSSTLFRAQMTAMLVMSVHHDKKIPYIVHSSPGKLAEWSVNYSSDQKMYVPMITAWELNERMYGKLQGLNKEQTRKKFGDEQVHIWRRSFDVPPPEGESLEMTAKRCIPYFQKEILPHLKEGKNVLISAHGNSLRSIVMFLDNLSKEEVLTLEIPTGKALIYHYSQGRLSKDGQ